MKYLKNFDTIKLNNYLLEATDIIDSYRINEVNLPGMSGNKVTGWVNVKIDKDLPLRVSRYITSIEQFIPQNSNSIKEDLENKLKLLSNPRTRGVQVGPQAKLAIMILLQYLNEVKTRFEASSAGYLFEDYIAGLLHGERTGGYGNSDYEDDNGSTYQIKFIRYAANSIDISSVRDPERNFDYYIVGLKSEDSVFIWIIDSTPNNISQFNASDYIIHDPDNVNRKLKIDTGKLKSHKIYGVDGVRKLPYELKFDKLDRIIRDVGKELEFYVSTLYDRISDLHYNIETIITGTDKKSNFVGKNIDAYYDDAVDNIDDIKKKLDLVKKDIKHKIKHY